jgi:hypothetical protein
LVYLQTCKGAQGEPTGTKGRVMSVGLEKGCREMQEAGTKVAQVGHRLMGRIE